MKKQYRSMIFASAISILITGAAFKANTNKQIAKAYTPESLSQEERLEKDIQAYNIENDILPPAYMSDSKMASLGVSEGDTIEIEGKGIFIVRSIYSIRDDAVVIPSDEGENSVIYEYK